MTDYIVIRNEYSEGDYIESDDYSYGGQLAGTGVIETRITGDLAERIQTRSGLRGDVTITEEHWDDGYCVTCSIESVQFTVAVGGETVYTSPSGSGSTTGAEQITTFSDFNNWLNESAE